MAGLNYLDDTFWKYTNIGTADLLSVSGTTLTNLPETQAKLGTAFYQTSRAKCFDIPATNEIWIKFDVFFDGSNRWRAYNNNSYGVTGITTQTNGQLGFFVDENNKGRFDNICIANQLQTVLLHMVSDSSAGIVEAWIDGNFIYRYTGNVNKGEDFANIYLQSDGAGTFFSNVIISNAPIALDENAFSVIYDIAIKPEIYISWIPTGQVHLKPSILATYIPAPEKTSADTSRNVSKSESISADSIRHVTKSENNSADLLRTVIDSETSSADSLRKVYQPENFSGDTFRQVVQLDKSAADTFREVKKTEIAIADTSRKNGLTIISVDTKRNIEVSTKSGGDTCRKIGTANNVSADTILKTARTNIAQADTFRKLTVSTNANADTLRKIGVREKVSADTNLRFANREKSAADTFRQVAQSEIATADLNRAIREIAGYDTFRKVTHKEKAVASTVIRVPHIWNYFVKPALNTAKLLADNQPSLVNTFKDYKITAVDITLSERTLSDNFTFQTAKPVNINDHVQGSLLDYHFNFLVEETTQTDLITEVKGRYSQDDLLYTWFLIDSAAITVAGTEYEVPGGRIEKGKHGSVVLLYPKAIEIITRVAEYFGLTPDVKIDDFTPSNLQGDEMITYHDLLNSVFGWTSKVPQRQVNVFIRGGTLHCIQRGKEDSVFDITNLPHSRPTINRKFNRILCHNPNHTSNDDDINDRKRHYSGTLTLSAENMYAVYVYKNGLIDQELSSITTTEEDGKIVTHRSNTTYRYTSFSKPQKRQSKLVDKPDGNATVYVTYDYENNIEWYVKAKSSTTYAIETEEDTTTVTETNTTTSYNYKTISKGFNDYEVYLCFDKEVTTKKEYEQGHPEEADVERDIRETYYAPMGNGFYAQTVYLNGKPQGANISMGKPGNSVSQYTVDQFQDSFFVTTVIKKNIAENNDASDELSLIVDSSFPVRDADTKNALNDALRWLHRKVQETVTLDLISPVINGIPTINHIVDFTERIKLDGNEYFLVSNKITFTPRKLIQKLELIRWY